MLRKTLFLLPLCLVAPVAQAHSPYLKPNAFQPDAKRDHVTVEASFSEDDLRPDISMTADHWHATGPDGKTVVLAPAASLKDATYLEVPIASDGTWRISTGERTGRVAKAALQGTSLRFLEPGETPWPSEKVVDVQSVTRADVFVTRGKATATPAPENDLEIWPASAPNGAYTKEPVRVRLLDNGKPVKGEHVTIHGDNKLYQDKTPAPLDLVSDADGQVSFTPAQAGLYLIQARVRAPSATNPDLWISRTATLTLEVLPE